MKNKGRLFLWLIPMSLIIYILYTWFEPPREKFPSFNILLPDSLTIYNTKDLHEGKPTVLMFFSPDCDHCQRQVASILKNIDSLKNFQFLFITVDPFERMKQFYEFYKLKNNPNIILGRDYEWFFPNHYNTGQTPYIVVYDKDLRVKKAIIGITTCHKILQCLN